MPLTYTSPRELFLQLLEGQQPDAALVDELIAKASKEWQWHDFKEQNPSPDEQRTVIRRWVTGFANAEGGTLILGVSEPDQKAGTPRRVTGFEAPASSKMPTVDWVLRVLQDLAGRLSPPPLAVEVQHPDGPVVFVATNRAPGQIVSYREAGEVKYAVRIGESTVDLPASVVADLLLGRRAQPVLEVTSLELTPAPAPPGPIKIRVILTLENTSFVPSIDTRVGAVSWTLFPRDAEPEPVSSTLMQFIEKDVPRERFDGDREMIFRPKHHSAQNTGITISPFEFGRFSEIYVGRVPRTGVHDFALYVMPAGSMPTWYEVRCRYGVENGQINATMNPPERVMARRARIWWHS